MQNHLRVAAPGGSLTIILALLVVALGSQSCSLRAPAEPEPVQPAPAAPSTGAEAPQQKSEPRVKQPSRTQIGKASWYGPRFHGRPTASGEIFDEELLTAASRTLPLGSKARVTNLENDKSVEVTINDRGPYVGGRIIDLSRAAARVLDMIKAGIANVRVELLSVSKDL